jgi:hypothetical protein
MHCNAMHSIVNRLEYSLSAYLLSSASASSSSASSPASAPATSPAAYNNNNVLCFSQHKRNFFKLFLWKTFDKQLYFGGHHQTTLLLMLTKPVNHSWCI